MGYLGQCGSRQVVHDVLLPALLLKARIRGAHLAQAEVSVCGLALGNLLQQHSTLERSLQT